MSERCPEGTIYDWNFEDIMRACESAFDGERRFGGLESIWPYTEGTLETFRRRERVEHYLDVFGGWAIKLALTDTHEPVTIFKESTGRSRELVGKKVDELRAGDGSLVIEGTLAFSQSISYSSRPMVPWSLLINMNRTGRLPLHNRVARVPVLNENGERLVRSVMGVGEQATA